MIYFSESTDRLFAKLPTEATINFYSIFEKGREEDWIIYAGVNGVSGINIAFPEKLPSNAISQRVVFRDERLKIIAFRINDKKALFDGNTLVLFDEKLVKIEMDFTNGAVEFFTQSMDKKEDVQSVGIGETLFCEELNKRGRKKYLKCMPIADWIPEGNLSVV